MSVMTCVLLSHTTDYSTSLHIGLPFGEYPNPSDYSTGTPTMLWGTRVSYRARIIRRQEVRDSRDGAANTRHDARTRAFAIR